MRQLGKPWSIQISPVEGCTRICPFCGLNGIRNAPGSYKYMSLETAERAAVSIATYCPDARIEFALHGEPLIHPKIHQMISMFRSLLPRTQIQLTTNGSVLAGHMQARAERLFDAGLDFLILDTYAPEREALQVEAWSLAAPIQVVDFYNDWQPKGISPWHNHRRKIHHTIVLMDDLLLRDGEVRSRVIYNHAGNSAMARGGLAEPLQKKCTLPFREMSILWNGVVPVCCMDWGHELVVGNVNHDSLETIWNSPTFAAIRRLLFARQRTFSPCARCNYPGGGRMGLLPPQAEPTDADNTLISQVVMNSPRQNGFEPIIPLEAIK